MVGQEDIPLMEKKRKSGMVTLDNHPKSDSYWTKKKGECRWCGKKITKTPTERRGKEINMRKSWDEDCATEYMVIYHSGDQRPCLVTRQR